MKILVVDDDEIALVVLKKILENDSHEVLLAEDGEVALEILGAQEIDIVISDWNMPKINGIELCRQIKSVPQNNNSYIYFFLITSRFRKEDLIEGLSAGADDFITKPFQPAELLARLHTAERIVAIGRKSQHKVDQNLDLIKATSDIILRIRSDGVIIDYKTSSNSIFGISEDKLNGESITSILPDTVFRQVMPCIEKTLKKKEIQTLEFNMDISNVSYAFEVRLKDSGTDEVTALVRDITHRAHLESILESLKE